MVEFEVNGDFDDQSEELSAHGINIKIEYSLVGLNKYIAVHRVEARGKGDQAMDALSRHLQRRASERNITIVDVSTPTNKAAWNLVRRHREYNLDSVKPMRIYTPQRITT